MKFPRQVLLFSGHMIDAPERREPRFPPDKEEIAAHAIAATLRKIEVGAQDLGICGGACGGDLLFAEACLARGAVLELYIPFEKETFLAKSVDFADARWRDRFHAVTSQATLHVMPDELGPLPSSEDPYERNNLWMLKSADPFRGTTKFAFITLVEWAGRRRARVAPGTLWRKWGARRITIYWLDTRQLWELED